MRIVLISDPYPPVVWGGYELEAAAATAALREAGHEVVVLSGDAEAEGLPAQPGVRRALHHDRGELRRDTLLAVPRAAEADRVIEALLREVRPHLLYAFNVSGVSRLPLLRAMERGVPLLVRACEHWVGDLLGGDRFLRELVPGRSPRRLPLTLATRAANRAHPRLRVRLPPARPYPGAVAWVSARLRELAPIDPRIVDVRHETVFPPANAGAELFAAAVRRPSPEPSLLFVGPPAEHKGADVLVRALGHLRRADGSAPAVTMLGRATPVERDAILALAAREGVADRLEVRGPVPAEEVVAAAERAHAWVVPSVWEEPAATAVAEGALARVPLVVSNVGGNAEIVGPRDGALYVPPSEPVALAEAIRRTLADPADARERAGRARERALAVASLPVVTERYRRFLDDACAALGVDPG